MSPRSPGSPVRTPPRTSRGTKGRPASSTSTVSTVSAARFAARVRARRLRRIALVTALFLVVLVGGWAALLAPWATVDRISVRGLDRVPETQVQAIGRTQLGSALLLVDTTNLARSVQQLDLVRSASVRRSWPSTLVIEVTERKVAAAVPVDGGAVLVDADGQVVEKVTSVAAGIPVIRVDLTKDQGTETFRAALAVRNGLPDDVVETVRRLGASGVNGVWTEQKNGSRVLWGSSADLGMKVEALRALWSLPRSDRPAGRVEFDVSAPRTPAVRPLR